MPLAHCSIGTSRIRINMLDEHGGHVGDWTPVAGAVDAVFSSSALADYRTLKYYREITTEEKIEFTVKRSSQDSVIEATQNLRRMCRMAMDYWVESWQDEPVYLAVQASCETNRRYAIIHSGAVPEDNNPFGQPFIQQGDWALMVQVLVLERGPWLNTAPGVATCIEACAPENYYCWPSYLEFDGVDDNVNCASDAIIDDLPGSMTAEAWIRADSWGEQSAANEAMIICKWNDSNAGWRFGISNTHGLFASIAYSVTDAWSSSGPVIFSPDGEWHHVAFSAQANWIYMFIDGVEVNPYAFQIQGVGVPAADAAFDLYIGGNLAGDRTWDGGIGWVRLDDTWLYLSDFAPDARCAIPEKGIQTRGIWIVEGEGGTTANRYSQAATVGTINGATWGCDCPLSYGRMCGDLTNCWPAYCTFDGATDYIDCRDYAEIIDLPDDTHNFTVEAWIKADGWGEGNNGYICQKGNVGPDDGWYFSIDNAEGLYFWVHGGGGGADGEASSGLDEFSIGDWVHVVGTVTPTGGVNATLNLAIDGTWVASYVTHVNKTGAYQQDSGDNLYIGNRSDSAKTFDGLIGWVRLSTSLRYTVGVNFDPPERCSLDLEAGNTAGIWIYEGYGPYTWNLAVAEHAILASSRQWGCDCDYDVDQSTSCLVQPYIANYLKTSGLTHVYWTDASGPLWSINLLNSNLPYALLPTVPAVGDAVYFGVDDSLKDSGPFCNLVFDLIPYGGTIAGIWEMWDPTLTAWNTMTVQDNTDADGLMTGLPFDTAGIKSVHWRQSALPWGQNPLPTASGDATAPPVNAWWIRYRVTGIASPVPPWQQNRHVYTISWPYIEIQDDDVPGDIAASLALELFNESDHDGGSTAPQLMTNRVITGLRNLDRGEDFVAYFNAADEQNPSFITCTVNPAPVGGPVLFQNAATPYATPTNREIAYTNLNAADLVCSWSIDAEYSAQFFGEYRAFVRCDVSGGAGVGDVALAIGISYGGATASIAYGEWKYNEYTAAPFMVELGRAVIPPSDDISSSDNAEIVIDLWAASGTGGAISLYVMDIILMPVDEWGGEFTGIPTWVDYVGGNRSMAVGDWGGKGRYLFVDSITYPKRDIRAMTKIRTTENFVGLVRPVSNRPAPLRQNATQRLWFLCERFTSTNRTSSFEIAHSVQVYAQAHYLSMRGDR